VPYARCVARSRQRRPRQREVERDRSRLHGGWIGEQPITDDQVEKPSCCRVRLTSFERYDPEREYVGWPGRAAGDAGNDAFAGQSFRLAQPALIAQAENE
jgi:hypothetical protein